MQVNAKVDYALRAVVELAGSSSRQAPRKLHELAEAQAIPEAYLADILNRLRAGGVVGSQRGSDGGYWLTRPADEIDLGRVIRAVEGVLVEVRGQPPEELEYVGSALALQQVWIALRNMFELVTVADVVAGDFPADMLALARNGNAREPQLTGEHARLG